jgi:hypothetical protein
MNPQERPRRPPVRPSRPQNTFIAFLSIWVVLMLLCGVTHVFIGFATLLAAGDTGRASSPIYILYLFGGILIFAVTQLGVLFGGLWLLRRGRPVWQVAALALALYGISLCSLGWTDLLPREFFTTGQ